jgi:hypothetical protein
MDSPSQRAENTIQPTAYDADVRRQLRLIREQLRSIKLKGESPISQDDINSVAGPVQRFIATVENHSSFSSESVILETSHWGEPNQPEIDRKLLTEKRPFQNLYSIEGGARIGRQMKYEPIYEGFSDSKKLLFHYFFELSENLMSHAAAQSSFNDYGRIQMFRVCSYFADISNSPTTSYDCLIANDKLMISITGELRDRPYIGLGGNQSGYIAARFSCQLINGSKSLTYENRLQASHKCGVSNCIHPRHIVPESDEENKSRRHCHSFGCAFTCPHEEPCSFHTEDGSYISCRNNNKLEQCECGQECFKNVDIPKAKAAAKKYRAKKEEEKRDAKSNQINDEAEFMEIVA